MQPFVNDDIYANHDKLGGVLEPLWYTSDGWRVQVVNNNNLQPLWSSFREPLPIVDDGSLLYNTSTHHTTTSNNNTTNTAINSKTPISTTTTTSTNANIRHQSLCLKSEWSGNIYGSAQGRDTTLTYKICKFTHAKAAWINTTRDIKYIESSPNPDMVCARI